MLVVGWLIGMAAGVVGIGSRTSSSTHSESDGMMTRAAGPPDRNCSAPPQPTHATTQCRSRGGGIRASSSGGVRLLGALWLCIVGWSVGKRTRRTDTHNKQEQEGGRKVDPPARKNRPLSQSYPPLPPTHTHTLLSHAIDRETDRLTAKVAKTSIDIEIEISPPTPSKLLTQAIFPSHTQAVLLPQPSARCVAEERGCWPSCSCCCSRPWGCK